jgi:hypothetical protein
MCVIGIFDRIFVGQVPAQHRRSHVVARVAVQPKESVAVRIDLVRPTGAVLKTVNVPVNVPDSAAADAYVHVHLVLDNLPLPDFGAYRCNVYLADELKWSLRLLVERAPQPSRPS